MPQPTITTNDLTFSFPDGTSGLEHVSLELPAGSRNLLIGGKHRLPNTSYTHAKSPEQMARAKQPSSAC